MAYLTTTNSKIEKGISKGYLTFGIHFAPSKLSGFDVCSSASEGCIVSCLNTSGMGAFSNVQKARIEKTKRFFSDIKGELETLRKEIASAIKKAMRKNLIPVFRLNLTSDIRWEKLRLNNGNTLFEEFPSVQFYDYTKHADRMNLNIPNYALTFSRSEDRLNQMRAFAILAQGGNAAFVFSTKKGSDLPSEYRGFRVLDGDSDDLRFLDTKGCIIGLRAKGIAKYDESGFVIHV